MKNKEIEELLNNLYRYKSEDNKYYPEDILTIDDVWLLLSYIEQLEKKVDQYENPDDLTLFYMWLDEKAKDKMKQLENNRDKAIEEIKYLIGNCDIVDYRGEKIMNILKGDSDYE